MPSTDPSAAGGPVDEQPSGAPPHEAGRGGRPDHPYAFPRDARLLDKRGYDAVFGDNRRVADRLWTVLAHRVPSVPRERVPGTGAVRRDGAARLGLAIAKKRARRAVDRNRIKRVARESFRHARAALDGHHVVVMNRDAASTASAAELRAALDALWSRLLRPTPEANARRSAGRPSARASSGGTSARAATPRPGARTAAGASDDRRARAAKAGGATGEGSC